MAEIKDGYEINEKVTEKINEMTKIPTSYIEVRLSTKGKLYAPEVFHIRNFTVEDLIGIAIVDDETLPIKILEMLQKIIYEKDVDVRKFHESEIKETLFTLYQTFYSPVLSGIEYTLTEKDWEYVAQLNGGRDSAEFREYERGIKNGQIKPKFDLDLRQVKKFEMPDNFKKEARVKKSNGFTCKYSMPQYGDVLFIKEYVDQVFKEEDRKFERLGKMIQFEDDAQNRFRKGENINLASIPSVSNDDRKLYNDYQANKSACILVALRAIHLTEYNGEDVSDWSLEKKFELAKDPELDYGTFKKVTDTFSKVKIGLDPNVTILNPVTGGPTPYEYDFRLFTVLEAIGNNDIDGVTIDFE